MTSTLEAMARVAYENYMDGLINCCELPWNKLPQDHRDRMIESQRAALRAAIKEMMQPSNKAAFQGAEKWREMEKSEVTHYTAGVCAEIWQAMLAEFEREELGDE